MVTIIINEEELWDEDKEIFVTVPGSILNLEHSLKSLYEWEAIWNVPFLHTDLTNEQTLSYIKCMTINKDEVNQEAYSYINNKHISQILDYISSPQTATWFSDSKKKKNARTKGKEIITAEIIYYWMTVQNIPFECENWNLDRLLTLIQVCSEKNNPDKKKMSKREIYSRNAAINAARRAKFNSKG